MKLSEKRIIYIEILFQSDINQSPKSLFKKVDDRVITNVKKEEGMIAFRFFDIVETYCDDVRVDRRKENEQPLIYFGYRCTPSENEYLNSCNDLTLAVSSYCHINDGLYVEMEENAKTYDEALAEFEKSNKEIYQEYMYNMLKDNIEMPVTCEAWWFGNYIVIKGTLLKVNDFEGVVISDFKIPFLGKGIAIKQIINNDGKVIYINNHLENNYNRQNVMDIYDIIKKTYGDTITNFIPSDTLKGMEVRGKEVENPIVLALKNL